MVCLQSDDLDAGKWIISLQETKKKPDLLWSSHHQCVKRDYVVATYIVNNCIVIGCLLLSLPKAKVVYDFH